MLCIQILAVFCTLGHVMTAEKYNDHCENQKAQNGIDLDELMGTWYGLEVFYHRPRSNISEEMQEKDTCLLIQLSMDGNREITMSWQEPGRFVDYYFNISGHPGVWHYEWTSERRYKATVTVLKAVSTHMVLNFCSHIHLYSIMMSREKYLYYRDIEDVDRMLDTNNLPVYENIRLCPYSNGMMSNAMCITPSSVTRYTLVYIAAVICLALLRS